MRTTVVAAAGLVGNAQSGQRSTHQLVKLSCHNFNSNTSNSNNNTCLKCPCPGWGSSHSAPNAANNSVNIIKFCTKCAAEICEKCHAISVKRAAKTTLHTHLKRTTHTPQKAAQSKRQHQASTSTSPLRPLLLLLQLLPKKKLKVFFMNL